MKDLIIIGICLIIIVVLLMIGIETGIFDAVSEAFYNWFHPKKDYDLPDINFTLLPEYKEHARRCTECNSIITGQEIVIVRDDDVTVGLSGALGGGQKEVELYEAIYCTHCGHQNIIGKYYREFACKQKPTIEEENEE